MCRTINALPWRKIEPIASHAERDSTGKPVFTLSHHKLAQESYPYHEIKPLGKVREDGSITVTKS